MITRPKQQFSQNASDVLAFEANDDLSLWDDDLRNGIWPRSFALWSAVFYVALFVIRPWEKLIPELATIRFERICAILMIVVVVLSGRFRLRLDLQTISVFLFTGALCISGLNVGGLSVPYVFLTLVVFYLILVSVIRSPYELVFMLACYLVTMGVYLGKSQWEFFVHSAGIYEMGVKRLQGIDQTFGNDNAVANSVVYSLPILCFLFHVRREFCVTWPSFWRKWFVPGLAAYAVLAVSSILLTRSRMGAVSLVVFLLLLAMRGGNFLQKLAAIAVVPVFCVGIYFVLPPDAQERLRTIWTTAEESDDKYTQWARGSTQGRWDGLHAGVSMSEDYPLFGVGIGNFIPYRVDHVDGVNESAHNLLGEMLGETGYFGLFAFLLLVSAILFNFYMANCVARIANGRQIPEVMAQLALSCRDVVILLCFTGLSTHNLDRFNWLWAGAFCALAVQFGVASINDEPEEQTVSFDPGNRS